MLIVIPKREDRKAGAHNPGFTFRKEQIAIKSIRFGTILTQAMENPNQ